MPATTGRYLHRRVNVGGDVGLEVSVDGAALGDIQELLQAVDRDLQ